MPKRYTCTTRIRTKYVHNLSQSEYQNCQRLTFGTEGLMQRKLSMARHAKRDGGIATFPPANPDAKYQPARAVLLEDSQSGRLLGWALIWYDYRTTYKNQQYQLLSGSNPWVMLYVLKSYRRHGFGSRLLRKCRQLEPNVTVCPHDKVSYQFFLCHTEYPRSEHYARWPYKKIPEDIPSVRREEVGVR